jgi:hypothetical protein
MKKIYSIILLFTFLIGTLQPIMPMIEYQLFEGDIAELLDDDTCTTLDCCMLVQSKADVNCPDCDIDENQQLLDTDFYPLALEITTIPDPRVFLIGERFGLPLADETADPAILPIPPPPWLS